MRGINVLGNRIGSMWISNHNLLHCRIGACFKTSDLLQVCCLPQPSSLSSLALKIWHVFLFPFIELRPWLKERLFLLLFELLWSLHFSRGTIPWVRITSVESPQRDSLQWQCHQGVGQIRLYCFLRNNVNVCTSRADSLSCSCLCFVRKLSHVHWTQAYAWATP